MGGDRDCGRGTVTAYAVFRQGVYRHECGGIFSTEALAQATANALAGGDVDGYHTYEVVPFAMDEPTPVTAAGGYSPDLNEARPVYVATKSSPAPPQPTAAEEAAELAALSDLADDMLARGEL